MAASTAAGLGFMVDTGASVDRAAPSAMPPGSVSARRERDFTAGGETANGTVRAARGRCSIAVDIGDLVGARCAALVVPDEALNENLLGLSFLSRLKRFEYANGKLVLEQLT